MVLLFILLVMVNGIGGILVWLAWQRITDHLRRNPEAAKLISEHVVTPLLTGKPEKPEAEKPEDKAV